MAKEQEKYKKRFKNSLKSNKNKWHFTNSGIESKTLNSKYRLKRRSDILKKHYISEKELEFLVDQVTSESGYNMLKEDIILNHSFNGKYFLELRKRKEASFMRKDNCIAEQSTSAGKNTMINNVITDLQKLEIREQDNVAPWQEILNKEVTISRPEFHRGLNSVRDLRTLTTYCDRLRRKRFENYRITYDYIVRQCGIRACNIKEGLWH
ncbi:hypothetical protein RhiirA4_469162 [Rhizophagus irregularis]|uniref:Uncharacterized protein n=1 Tax=Rhizophagus irregularis TaxID=588596 RepID=A0A2I1GZ01_9GLOM|nr:hypothetical protein RhiirA4_469162 [Rhizophagus irregularis]